MAQDDVGLIAEGIAQKVTDRYAQAAERMIAADTAGDLTEDDILDALYELSDAPLDQYAAEGTRGTMRGGRGDEFNDPANGLPDDVQWRRSSVLEPSTCGPCEAADGEELDSPDEDLSSICEGSELCKCFPYADLLENVEGQDDGLTSDEDTSSVDDEE